MKSEYMQRFRVYTGVWLAMLAVWSPPVAAQEVAAVPDYLTYIFPAYFPKNGQTDYSTSGMTPGDVRNMMANYYEGWWREVSYHRANPTSGLSDRGFYMDTKTVGEVALPWAMSPGNVVMGESNVVGVVVGTATAELETEYSGVLSPLPVGGRTISFVIGSRLVSSSTGHDRLGGDGTGLINLATGAYSFKLNLAAPEGTPIEVFYVAYIQGAAPSPANWANFSQPLGDDTAISRIPDGRGEHFMETAYEDTSAVLYMRWDPAVNAWIDDPLVDGFWTPGERFTDQPRGGGSLPPTGGWNPYEHAEDRWTPSIIDWGIVDQHSGVQILPGGMREYMESIDRGDFFLDYNFSILEVDEDGRVLAPAAGFSSLIDFDVGIQVADRDRRVNVSTNISEFNLTPPRFFRSRVDVVVTNITEDSWTYANRDWMGGIAGTLLLQPENVGLATLLGNPTRGGVIADYTLSILATTNQVNSAGHSRVAVGGGLAFTNNPTRPFYVADFTTGQNRAVPLSSLDLTPPLFYTNFTSGALGPAEDRWVPTLNFTGIAATLAHLAGIRALFAETNADGERFRGSALLDYSFAYAPSFDYWGADPTLVGTRNVNIYVADIVAGTNVPVAVDEMDLTPPRWYRSGTPRYGATHSGEGVDADSVPSVLEGDASHRYISEAAVPAYADIPRLGRFEVNFDVGGNPAMQDSGTNVSIRVYLLNALYAEATNSTGEIGYPDPDSRNRFIYDTTLTPPRVRILGAGSDFWTECVETGALAYPATQWSELPIPLYYAERLWGEPVNVGGADDYLAPAPGASVSNPFRDAVGSDDVWTPGRPSSFTPALPYYGTDGVTAITNDPTRTLEGDTSYTYNPGDPASLVYTNIPGIGRFEYQVSSVDGRGLVYLAADSYIEVKVLLPSGRVNALLHPTNPRLNGAIYDATLDRIVVTNTPGNTDNTRAFGTYIRSAMALGAVTSNSISLKYPAHVQVPVFYAEGLYNTNFNYRILWGRPDDTNYLATPAAPGGIDSRFVDTTPAIYGGPDNQWTPHFTVSITNPPVFFVSFDADGNIQTNDAPLSGDAQWTYVRDNTAPPPNLRPTYDNVGFLNRIEYNVDGDSRPHIYKSDFTIPIETYVDLPQTLLDELASNEGTVIQGFTMIDSRLHVPTPPSDFFGSDFVPGSMPHTGTATVRSRAYVHVPLYYSARIWGEPQDAGTYTDHFTVGNQRLNPFVDSIGNDQQWTAAIPADPFSDFIPLWDPVGSIAGTGIWVPGLVGTPNAGVLPRGTEPTQEYWTWQQYTNYIANNYPGDVDGLIARADNDLYDGPERWAEVDNNQMIQDGYLPLPTVTLGSWDFSVGPAHINSYEDWWLDRYGAYGSTSSVFVARVPNIREWKPELTDFNQPQPMTVTTNISDSGEVTTSNTYGAVTHPPYGTTWTYDAPRQFDDLPSSLHVNAELGALSGIGSRYFGAHNPAAAWDGGDFRLGEVTSPWNNAIWGHDRGYDNPNIRNLEPDDILRMAGPYAYNVYANFGYDAANLLNLEFVTHRRNGQNLTGPRGGHAKPLGYCYLASPPVSNYTHAVMYARDHRDTNLNGLIDQGETIPANSHNYMVDPQADSPDNGRSSLPIFGWARVIEHLVSIYDAVEDFGKVGLYTVPGRTGSSDQGIMQPSGFRWFDGMQATATLASIVGAPVVYADTDGSGDYTPGTDALWVDSNGDGFFDAIEELIFNPGGALGPQEEADGAGPYTAQWADLDGDGLFNSSWDLAWLDTMAGGAAGVFDSEPVLADTQGILQPGIAAQGFRTYAPALSINRSIYVYPDMANFQLMWAVTNSYSGPNEVYPGSTNGVDLIYREVGYTPPVSGGTTGVRWTGAAVMFVSAKADKPVYFGGDSVFIDTNGNGRYDGDTVVSRLTLGLRPGYDGLVADGTFTIGYTVAEGVVPVVAGDGFDRATSAVWLESSAPGNRRNGELLISGSSVPTGTPADGDVSANIQWIDLPMGTNAPSGGFDPVRLADGSDLSYPVLGDVYIGDALFYDRNANGLFDFGATIRRGVYIAPLYNHIGIQDPGLFRAGHIHGVMTREGYLTDFSQVNSVLSAPGFLTHEQGHDILEWPDLYDYNVSDPEVNHNPVSTADLMSGGGLVHGYPDLKFRTNPFGGGSWTNFNAVDPQELNTGPGALLTPDGTVVTLTLYPVERHPDQYYVFRKQGSPQEFFTLAYNAGPVASPYANPIGRGLMITKSDYEISPSGRPQQQRSNNRFTWLVVQADARYNLEDGFAGLGPEDAFGNTPETRVFSAHTRPPATWWDESGSGLRVLDIRIPEDPFAAAEVDLQWVPIAGAVDGDFPIHYNVPPGYDSDGDGIPDAWEYYWFGRYPDPLAVAGIGTDYSLNGLSDYYAWLAGANPTVRSSWTGAINPHNLSDADLDIDGDGLSNAEEEARGTHPRLPDTADNGLLDGSGLDMQPSTSLVPLVDRVLALNGAATSYVETPNQPRFALRAFTVQAWVRPATAAGTIIARQVQSNAYNYRMRLTADRRIELSFTPSTMTADVVLESPVGQGLPLNDWTHVAGTFNPNTGYLRIYLNGVQAASLQTGSRPAVSGLGPTWTRIGSGFAGLMDEVLVSAVPFGQTTITAMLDGVAKVPVTTNTTHVAYYRFEDGTSATGPDGSGRHYGTSMNTNWWWGQVEDFAAAIVTSVAVTTTVDGAGVTNSVTNTTMQVARRFEKDWMNDWRNGGTLMGHVAMLDAPSDAPVLYAMMDSNNDGIPDWWYRQYGYDPEGRSIAYEDPDMDGLSNIQEFLAGTDPHDPDTLNTGFGDYDSRISAFEPTFGQRFDDGDRIADAWEVLYMDKTPGSLNRSLDPAYYDAHLDPDEDGWSNYAEFMWSKYVERIPDTELLPSDPTDPQSYPTPLVRVSARYSGRYGDNLTDVLAGGQLHLHFYDTPTRDGFATAIAMTGTSVTELREFDSGHLTEGMNYIFAFVDLNGDGEWDPVDEPAGIASFNMGWGDWNEVEIPLTDDRQMRGFPRLLWEPVPNEEQAVTLGYTVIAKKGPFEVFTRFVENPSRNYIHEGDYLAAGLDGLGGDGSEEPYTFEVYKNNTVYGYDFETPQAILIAIVTNTVSETPAVVTGHDITFVYARNELAWTMDANATWYQMTFRANGADATVNLSGSPLLETGRLTAPFRDLNGQYRSDLPFYAGDVRADGSIWTNGRYWVRITTGMEFGGSVSSAWMPFNLGVREPGQNNGKSMIAGKLYYFGGHDFFSDAVRRAGAVSNQMPVVVQSFSNPGFSGVPDAQVTIAPSDWVNTDYRHEAAFQLKGLHRGSHYLRAFVDSNGNGKLDYWETWGYGKDNQTYYEPVQVNLESTGAIRVVDQMVIIRDRDTDDDGLPDIWEYHNYGTPGDDSFLTLHGRESLGANGLPFSSRWQYGLDALTTVTIVDQNNNGIPDEWELYYFGALLGSGMHLSDYDGDGMSIYEEYLNGSDPTNPADSLKLATIMPTSGSPVLTWSGTSNYRVMYTDSLMATWTLDNNLANYTWDGVFSWTYTDPAPMTGGSRFYRVVVVDASAGTPP